MRLEETVMQMSLSIKYFDSVFKSLEKNLNVFMTTYMKSVETFEDRLNLIDHKIKKIKGTNKAIHIFSSSKYPKNHEFLEFDGKNEKSSSQYETESHELFRGMYNLHTQSVTLDDFNLKDKNKFYMIDGYFNTLKPNCIKSELERPSDEQSYSICNLLLFNTAKHTYVLLIICYSKFTPRLFRIYKYK